MSRAKKPVWNRVNIYVYSERVNVVILPYLIKNEEQEKNYELLCIVLSIIFCFAKFHLFVLEHL